MFSDSSALSYTYLCQDPAWQRFLLSRSLASSLSRAFNLVLVKRASFPACVHVLVGMTVLTETALRLFRNAPLCPGWVGTLEVHLL